MKSKAAKFGVSALIVLLGCLVGVTTTYAAPWAWIRIGDLDGFGYKPITPTGQGLTGMDATVRPGIRNAQNGVLDQLNHNGILEAGEFIPDHQVPVDGNCVAGGGDAFNQRSAAEALGNNWSATPGSGAFAIGGGMTGSQYTDISIDQAWASETPGAFFNTGNGVFPFANPAARNMNSLFRFNFSVPDINMFVPGAPMYARIVIADYNNSAGGARTTVSNATSLLDNVPLVVAPANLDGYIQLYQTNTLPFSSIFTYNAGADTWDAFLEVYVYFPQEYYYAIDYVEFGTTQPIPEPATYMLLGVGALGFLLRRIKQSRRAG